MTDVLIDARRGAGSSLEIIYGTVTWKPTLTHSRGTSIVLPAPTTYDLVDGQVVATNVQPTPEPVAGQVEWAYEVTFKDRHSKTYSFLVGVPDSTTQVNFTSLPRYFETAPPLFGQGPKGEQGESATVAVGTVTSGTTPSITNSGTNTEAILNFTLPKGDKGDTGAGVPTGGTSLQYVRKNSGNTGTEWATLNKASVGLSNVDNTSDATKPLVTSSVRGLMSPEDKTLLGQATSDATPDTLARRSSNGSLSVGVPIAGDDAINKTYADSTYLNVDALDEVVRRPRVNWEDVTEGFGIHRTGGGDIQFMPSGTLEAARACISMGSAFLDVDARLTANGTLIMLHDSDLAPNTNLSGPVTSLPDAALGALKIRAGDSAVVGGSWNDLPVPTLEEYLDSVGGIIPIGVEIKHSGSDADYEALATRVADTIHSRGLEKSVLIQVTEARASVRVPILKALGLMVGQYGDATNTLPAVAQAVSRGVDWVLLSRNTPDNVTAAWVSSGLQVVGYVGRRDDPVGSPNYWAARGVSMVLGDRASYAYGTGTILKSSFWGQGIWSAGDYPNTATRPKLEATGLVFGGSAEDVQSILVGDLAPLPTSCVIEMDYTYSVVSASTWIGLLVCAPSDSPWNASGTVQGYHCAAWSSGGLRIWDRSTGSSVDNGTTSGANHVAVVDEPIKLRVTLSPATVKLEICNSAGTVYQTKTYNDTRWRGGYLHVGVNGGAGPNRVKITALKIS